MTAGLDMEGMASGVTEESVIGGNAIEAGAMEVGAIKGADSIGAIADVGAVGAEDTPIVGAVTMKDPI